MKKIIGKTVLVTIVIASSWYFRKELKGNILFDLNLSNIEALAQVSEGPDGGIILTCGKYEGICWAIDWVSAGGYIHCYFDGSPLVMCYPS